MCGRVTLTYSINDLIGILKNTFYINHVPNVFIPYQYNIAPTDPLGCMVAHKDGYRIGTIPWGYPSPIPGDKKPIINIRSEQISNTPLFKNDFSSHRCIILASGYVEWNPEKQPYYFTKEDQPLLYLAGLWGKSSDGSYHCGVITQQANQSVSNIHHRMPVNFTESQVAEWLNPNTSSKLINLLKSTQIAHYRYKQLDKKINSPKYKSADLFIN